METQTDIMVKYNKIQLLLKAPPFFPKKTNFVGEGSIFQRIVLPFKISFQFQQQEMSIFIIIQQASSNILTENQAKSMTKGQGRVHIRHNKRQS